MKSGETVWAKRGWKVYDDTSCRLVWRVWWMYGRLGGSAVGNAMYGYLRVVVRGTWGGTCAGYSWAVRAPVRYSRMAVAGRRARYSPWHGTGEGYGRYNGYARVVVLSSRRGMYPPSSLIPSSLALGRLLVRRLVWYGTRPGAGRAQDATQVVRGY